MIEIKDIKISLDDYLQINAALMRQQLMASRGRIIGYAFFILLILLQSGLAWRRYLAGEADIPVFMSAILLVVLMLPWLILRRLKQTLRKQHAVHPTLQSTSTYQLSDAGIVGVNDVSRNELSWPAVQRVWRFKQWMLVFLSDNDALYLDLNRLTVPSQPQDLLQLFDNKGIKVQ